MLDKKDIELEKNLLQIQLCVVNSIYVVKQNTTAYDSEVILFLLIWSEAICQPMASQVSKAMNK